MDFLAILQRMAASGLEFVIVGGTAARLYGSTRLTQDVDVVPRLEPPAWGRLVHELWALGARPRIPESKECVSDPANVRRWINEKGMLTLSFRSPDGNAEVDLLVAESDRLDDLLSRATSVEIEGQTFHVASLDDLIEMKRLAGRPQDLLDVAELELIRERIEGA